MPADSNFPNLPPSPIRDDDKFLVNRDNVSHKIDASDLLYYLANLEFPVIKPCDGIEDCPPGYECFNGYCVQRCDSTPCPDGFVCVDVGPNSYCLPYPFPCGSIGTDPCPPGYVCIGGFCFLLCDAGQPCPPGTICANIQGEDICVPYPFPCPENNLCPNGFVCWEGFCLLDCTSRGCPPGSECLEIYPGQNACVPFPFPCGSLTQYLPDSCPPGFYCYNGRCYPECVADADCPPGYLCTDVGCGHHICYPETPAEGLINDGPLSIRTIPIDPAKDPQENIIFTANQFGRSVLTFQGFMQDCDLDPGGGSGGNLIINIDPDWWNPEVNVFPPGDINASPVRNGPLNVTNTYNQVDGAIYTANQDKASELIFADGVELYYHTPSSGTFQNEVGGKLWVGIDRTHVNFWQWNVDDNPEFPHNGSANDGKTYFKMAQNVDIVPNGSDCNLGRDGERWKNVYTQDLQLSNEGSSNDVDGTWGNWTMQEGEDDLFIINNRTGKKYKFKLEEV